MHSVECLLFMFYILMHLERYSFISQSFFLVGGGAPSQNPARLHYVAMLSIKHGL